MAGVVRLAGISAGSIDADHARASFALRFGAGPTLTCIASIDVIDEMAASLSALALSLRRSAPQVALAKPVLAYTIERGAADAQHSLFLRLVMPGGLSQTYALQQDIAGSLATRLDEECAVMRKPIQSSGET